MFVDYSFAKEQPTGKPAGMYEYVVAQNGVFVRAERPGLQVQIGIASADYPINGLVGLDTFVVLTVPKVPEKALSTILEQARKAAPNEILFWLQPPTPERSGWRMITPEQVASPMAVHPVDPFDPESIPTLIEVHSHHGMEAFFSGTDDRDETGFRIYAVLGEIDTHPTIRVRAGVYGHFSDVAADQVFHLPQGIADANHSILHFGEPREFIPPQEVNCEY
jgi:PRTRC genetic system protein A